jgi:hypothetical protein
VIQTRRSLALLALAGAALSGARCSRGRESRAYAPGLGEIMTLNQMRHAKLWFAGRQNNWALADYELDELQEGFDDVVKYHPTHKDAPLPLSQLVPKIMGERIHALRAAIASRDPKAFDAAYDDLTAGCNDCHRATNFGFNVVRRPEGSAWYGNQDFASRANPQP